MLGVNVDFPCDERAALLECLDLGLDMLTVGVEEFEPFGLVAGPLPYQFGEPLEVGNGHAGLAQLHTNQQPLHVNRVVLASATGGSPDRSHEEFLTLVETQRVHAEAGALSDVADAQRLGVCVNRHETPSFPLDLDLTLGPTVAAMTTTDQRPLGSPFGAASTAEDVMADVDLTGVTAVVTGGYSGLGLATTRSLAASGARVIVPARRLEVARSVLDNVDGCDVIGMDLTDLSSVRRAAAQISDAIGRLDLLMAIAGVMATPQWHVGPGWESQLAANHFGHFTLACELYPLLAAADGARVVVNSSAAHTLTDIRWDDPHFRTGYDKWLAYGQAKTANSLFAVHLDSLGADDGVRAFTLHPGKIITGLQREMSRAEQVERGWVDEQGNVVGAGFKTAAQGAATGLWAATSALLDGRGGIYLEDCDVAEVSHPYAPMDDGGVRAYATDPDAAARLWELSISATGATPIAR